MKKIKSIFLSSVAVSLLMVSCEGLLPENKVDLDLTEQMASISYTNLLKQGMSIYEYLPNGYNKLDGAMMAAATDEADHAVVGSDIEKFQLGTWNALTNPDNIWRKTYRGLHLSKLFLDNSLDYQKIILRDTSTASRLNAYLTQCTDLKALRAEAYVMNAYLYFELLKRYGGVPIIDKVLTLNDKANKVRSSYDQVVNHVISKLDSVTTNNHLQEDWHSYAVTSFGRIDKGTALALKSRILLYWASPQNNPTSDVTRWQKAAFAAKAVIDLRRYSIQQNYATQFFGANSHQNSGAIFSYMTGLNNTPEANNYPISTNGGATGTCPSANLVDAYENLDGTAFNWATLPVGANPYQNRDPRLLASIIVNNSTWNGRVIQCYNGGNESSTIKQGSTTGYYLRKFLTDGLDLELKQTAVHSWPLIRYAEVLLNYAEAMNQGYGPDNDHFGDGKTARWAINQVRNNVGMPDVVASDAIQMLERIKHERRIELAFEDHRFWDVRRWGLPDAKATLGGTLKGVSIVQNSDFTFTYTLKSIETRIFSDNMMLYPIPQSEILQSKNLITQNPGWEIKSKNF